MPNSELTTVNIPSAHQVQRMLGEFDHDLLKMRDLIENARTADGLTALHRSLDNIDDLVAEIAMKSRNNTVLLGAISIIAQTVTSQRDMLIQERDALMDQIRNSHDPEVLKEIALDAIVNDPDLAEEVMTELQAVADSEAESRGYNQGYEDAEAASALEMEEVNHHLQEVNEQIGALQAQLDGWARWAVENGIDLGLEASEEVSDAA